MKLLSDIFKTQWMIDPETLSKIYATLSNDALIEMLKSYPDNTLENTNYTEKRNDIAIINICGAIMRYESFYTRIFGFPALETIATDFQAALDDQQVKAIIFNIDSPGGVGKGINEFAEHVYASRSIKPIKAYVEGMCASAAYFIASACDEIITDDTAMLGSIGTIVTVRKNNDKDTIDIVSSQSPNKIMNPNDEKGQQKIRSMLDDITQVFLTKVARNKNMSVDDVINAGDSGGVVVGQKAVDAKLADRLGSFEELIKEIQQGNKNTLLKINNGVGYMNEPKAEIITNASQDIAQVKLEAEKAATNAERERVCALMGFMQAGTEETIVNAIQTGASVSDTAILIVKQLKAQKPVETKDEQKQGTQAHEANLYVAPLTDELKQEKTKQDADLLLKAMNGGI